MLNSTIDHDNSWCATTVTCRIRRRLRATIRAIIALAAALTLAQVVIAGDGLNTAFTYQGQLKQSGNRVNADADLRFILFDAAVGGAQVGSIQEMAAVAVSDGLFTVELDFGAGAFAGEGRWLEIAVRIPAGAGAYAVLSPRQALTATPYALHALSTPPLNIANFPPGGSWSLSSALNLAGALFVDPATNRVGIGTNAPARALDVNGTARMTGFEMPTGAAAGRVLRSDDTGAASWQNDGLMLPYSELVNAGLTGQAAFQVVNSATSGINYGASFGSSSTSGRGVYSVANAATGINYGVYGQSVSTNGRGIYGLASAASGGTFGGNFESASTSGIGAAGLASAATGVTFGLRGDSNSTSGYGVGGFSQASTGTTAGLRGDAASSSGRGVFGYALSPSGTNYGGYFISDSYSGTGVFGWAASTAFGAETYGVHGRSDSTAGTAIFGLASAATGFTYGGKFETVSTSGRGVYGLSTATTGSTYGGRFLAASSAGKGVSGVATANTGATFGGWFTADSASGIGAFGHAEASSGNTIGVYGRSDSPDSGKGVQGWCFATTGATFGVIGGSSSTTGYGVYGNATATSGANYGVYGKSTSTSGWGVYSNGNMGASGVKSFRIDHPFDPENKYLLHYASEAPEPQNFYNGIVTLNNAGEAWIELPDYFAEINRDPRYTLTPISAAMPNLHVAQKIVAGGNTFLITGGAPGMEVSWEVKAIRNDLWVRTRGAPIEIEKSEQERGKYQHPDLYNQPPEKGMDSTLPPDSGTLSREASPTSTKE